MSAIDKLISKINKAKSAVNSFKGIQSKIKSINYTSAIDALGEDAKRAQNQLQSRRERLEKSLTSSGKETAFDYASSMPNEKEQQMIYPYHDRLANYIVFHIRPRKQKGIGGDADAKARGTGSVGGKAGNHPVFKERSIALYVPDTLISQANVQYRQEGQNSLAKAIGDITENGFENAGTNFNTVITEAGFKMLNKMSGGLAGLKMGVAVNPKNEQILDGIPFRSWDFTFDFYPKSETEALQIRRIIYAFRSSMLPDTTTGLFNRSFQTVNNKTSVTRDIKVGDIVFEDVPPGLHFYVTDGEGKPLGDDKPSLFTFDGDGLHNMFMYPNVFDIEFVGPLKFNIDGFLPAVCTNAQVDYSGGQKFSTHADGMPTKIQLTLNFLEIQIMSLNNYATIAAKSLSKGEDRTLGMTTPSELNKTNKPGVFGSERNKAIIDNNAKLLEEIKAEAEDNST